MGNTMIQIEEIAGPLASGRSRFIHDQDAAHSFDSTRAVSLYSSPDLNTRASRIHNAQVVVHDGMRLYGRVEPWIRYRVLHNVFYLCQLCRVQEPWISGSRPQRLSITTRHSQIQWCRCKYSVLSLAG